MIFFFETIAQRMRVLSQLARDEQGTAIVEYSIFLSIVAAPALMAMISFTSTLPTTLQGRMTAATSYAMHPETYECTATASTSC
jgi:Flp pilus assembly pilin Flp